MTTGKAIALTMQTFVSKVMSLLFNTLSRCVIEFIPRRKPLLILWLQSLSAVILESRKIKSVTVFTFYPSICHKVMGLDAMIFAFWKWSFKPAFSLSSFTFINSLFSSSSLSAIKVISSAYLRLLIFLLEMLISALLHPGILHDVLIQAWWRYTALTYSFPNFEPVHCSIFRSYCCFLTCIVVSQETGNVVRYSLLFKNFPVCCDLQLKALV